MGITGVEDETDDDGGTGVEVRNMSSNSIASLHHILQKFQLVSLAKLMHSAVVDSFQGYDLYQICV